MVTMLKNCPIPLPAKTINLKCVTFNLWKTNLSQEFRRVYKHASGPLWKKLSLTLLGQKLYSNKQITENAASVTFIFWNSEVGIKIPQKYYGSTDGPEYFAFYEIKRIWTKKLDLFPSCRQKYKLSFFLLASFISLMRSENFISMNADRDWLETSRREIRGISGWTTSSRLLPFWRRITCNKKEISILRRKNRADLSLWDELLDKEEGDTEDEKGDGANV